MIKSILALALTTAIVAPSCAQPSLAKLQADAARATVNLWREKNELCRGGSGDDPKTMEACDSRERVSKFLAGMGMCYREGDYWVRCRS